MDNSSLILVARNFLWHIGHSLLGAHVLKKFGIARDLLDYVKKGQTNLYLIKDLMYFLHLYIIVIPKPIWKLGCRLLYLLD